MERLYQQQTKYTLKEEVLLEIKWDSFNDQRVNTSERLNSKN